MPSNQSKGHSLCRRPRSSCSAIAAMGTAQAPPIYFHHNHVRPGYAGQVYSSARVAQFVPGRRIVAESLTCPLAPVQTTSASTTKWEIRYVEHSQDDSGCHHARTCRDGL